MFHILKILRSWRSRLLLAFIAGTAAAYAAGPDSPTRYQTLARGEYLTNQVAYCFNCHGERDWRRQSAPVVPGARGAAAETSVFGSPLRASDITPAGVAGWRDTDLMRALIRGVAPDGRRIHRRVDGVDYSHLTEADAAAIAAYLRAAPGRGGVGPGLRSAKPPSSPAPYRPKNNPQPADSIERGRYLVLTASCRACHGPGLDGGVSLETPAGRQVVSANLTPAANTWVGAVDRERFIAGFKMFANRAIAEKPMAAGAPNTPMPYAQYAGLTEADLGAIYDYLQIIEPIPNKTEGPRP